MDSIGIECERSQNAVEVDRRVVDSDFCRKALGMFSRAKKDVMYEP